MDLTPVIVLPVMAFLAGLPFIAFLAVYWALKNVLKLRSRIVSILLSLLIILVSMSILPIVVSSLSGPVNSLSGPYSFTYSFMKNIKNQPILPWTDCRELYPRCTDDPTATCEAVQDFRPIFCGILQLWEYALIAFAAVFALFVLAADWIRKQRKSNESEKS